MTKRIEETGEGILSGRIGIHPLRSDKDTLACNFCNYKSICRRDGGYDRNYTNKLTPKPKKEKNADNIDREQQLR